MGKIKVTILGTTAGVPTSRRAHSGIHLNYTDAEEYSCLFDCGEGTQRQMIIAGLNMLKINDLFISHWHGDHCLGIPGLLDTMGFEGRSAPVNIYSPEPKRAKRCSNFINHTMGKVKIVSHKVPFSGGIKRVLDAGRFQVFSAPGKHSIPSVSYAFREKDKTAIDREKLLSSGLPEKDERYKRLKTGKAVMVNGVQVKLEDIQVTTKGKKVVYSGDTEICDNLKKLASGADLLIQDCTYLDQQDGKSYKHASLPEILEAFKECNVKKTVLTHISRKYQDPEKINSVIRGLDSFVIAEDFMVIEI